MITAMLLTDNYRETPQSIDDHALPGCLRTCASAADNRADRLVRLNREAV